MAIRQLKPSEVASVLDKLVRKQDHKCAVCGRPFTKTDRPVLDHSHDTGFIRGALHNSCNGAEGRIKAQANLGHKGVPSGEFVIALGKYLEDNEKPKYMLIHPTHLTEEQKRKKRNAKARATRSKKVTNANTRAT